MGPDVMDSTGAVQDASLTQILDARAGWQPPSPQGREAAGTRWMISKCSGKTGGDIHFESCGGTAPTLSGCHPSSRRAA